jgi:opacity protein-like surface antigen
MHKSFILGFGVIGALACGQANAFDTYLTLGVANNFGDLETKKDSIIEQSGVSYNVGLGATLNKNFAIELFYTRFGSDTGQNKDINFNVNQQGYGLSLNYRKPIYNDIYVLGSVGAQQLEFRETLFEAENLKVKYSDKTDINVTYGAGVGYRVTSNVNFEVKYSRFDKMNTVGGTFIYRF